MSYHSWFCWDARSSVLDFKISFIIISVLMFIVFVIALSGFVSDSWVWFFFGIIRPYTPEIFNKKKSLCMMLTFKFSNFNYSFPFHFIHGTLCIYILNIDWNLSYFHFHLEEMQKFQCEWNFGLSLWLYFAVYYWHSIRSLSFIYGCRTNKLNLHIFILFVNNFLL